MRFKIIVSNKESEIEESEIEGAIKLIGAGGIVVLKHIIFNSAYFQAIIPDHEGARYDADSKRYGMKKEERMSEFAKILGPKMTMLSDKNRTKAQEESAKEERKR